MNNQTNKEGSGMNKPFVECKAQCSCGREVSAKAGVRDGELVLQVRTTGQAVERTAAPMETVGLPNPPGPSLSQRMREQQR